MQFVLAMILLKNGSIGIKRDLLIHASAHDTFLEQTLSDRIKAK
jgi:hypothetical protein